jgi:hypothetical protein
MFIIKITLIKKGMKDLNSGGPMKIYNSTIQLSNANTLVNVHFFFLNMKHLENKTESTAQHNSIISLSMLLHFLKLLSVSHSK